MDRNNEPALALELIERDLNLSEPGASALPGWLVWSYSTPRSFWLALKDAQDRRSQAPGKSMPFKEYDLYHDLIARNLGNQAPAFCWYDAGLQPRELSYKALDELVQRRSAAWEELGVTAGEVICILRPMGLEQAVSVLTALKLGLTLSLLPPLGRSFLQTRLEALDPTRIDTDDLYLPLIRQEQWQDRVLERSTVEGSLPVAQRSHSYPSNSPCAMLFDPSSAECHIPRPLNADTAYLCALRDGLIALGLRRGEAVAAPCFHLLETQPALLLACLLSGGTYLHLELEDIEKDPSVLISRPVKAMGVDDRVRDILLERPQAVGDRWWQWFRNPAGSKQMEAWQRLIRNLDLKRCWSVNLKWDAALGGCSLFSARRRETTHFEVMPSAGVQWQLANPAAADADSPTDHGLLLLSPLGAEEEEAAPTGNIIAKQGRTWYFAGTVESTGQGRHYPDMEVLKAVEEMQVSCHFSLCRAWQISGDQDASTVLLVFTSGAELDEAQLRQQIIRKIVQEMGREFLPDRIQFVPLCPRFDDEGEVDHTWCQDQYVTGSLYKKSRDELYRTISRLRARVIPRQTPETETETDQT